MPHTATQAIVPTIAQYEDIMAPSLKRLTATQLFDYEARCLADARIVTVKELESLRAHIPEDGKRFLMIPPKPQIANRQALDALIVKVTYRDKKGVNYLNPQYLADEVMVPSSAYIMTEVDDGRSMLNIAPRDARIRLTEQNRSPFTWWEGYCLYLTFGFAVLGHHNVHCSGSRYGSEFMPYFYLYGDWPGFNDGWVDFPRPDWGSASCGSRIAA